MDAKYNLVMRSQFNTDISHGAGNADNEIYSYIQTNAAKITVDLNKVASL